MTKKERAARSEAIKKGHTGLVRKKGFHHDINKWIMRICELKFEGKTYPQIEQTIRDEGCPFTYSANYIRDSFGSSTGNWKYIYKMYEEEQIKESVKRAKSTLDKNSELAAATLVKYMKEFIDKNEYGLAIDLARDLLDRAGVSKVTKAEIKASENNDLSDEELMDELRRQGVDPESLLNSGVVEAETQEEV